MMNREFQHLRSQHTIAAPIAFVGIGLHTGQRVSMRILPAEAEHGIRFTRRDLPPGEDRFPARWDHVGGTEMCTTLVNEHGHGVATVEHLLSALSGLGIDNAEIVLDGAEIPVVDGSAMPFVSALTNAGIKSLDVPRDVLIIRRPVRIQQGEKWAELLPGGIPKISVSIDFHQRDIGQQHLSCCLSPSTYRQELCAARTFGFAEDVYQLRRRGLAQGGSLQNAILVENGRVANLEGLRYPDEFVRHKALDAVGDLSLIGLPIIGHYRANCPGHKLNNDLLRLLMCDESAWQRIAAADLLDNRVNGIDPAILGIPFEAAPRPDEDRSEGAGLDDRWRRVMKRMLGQRQSD